MWIYHIDQHKAAWFERDFRVSCASYFATQLTTGPFSPQKRNYIYRSKICCHCHVNLSVSGTVLKKKKALQIVNAAPYQISFLYIDYNMILSDLLKTQTGWCLQGTDCI